MLTWFCVWELFECVWPFCGVAAWMVKPRSVATSNQLHKAFKIPHLKVDIFKPSNNQSSAFSPNVIGTSCLNTREQPSPTNIGKSSRHVIKLSHLKTSKTAHWKLHHEGGVNTGTVSENRLHCKTHHSRRKYAVRNFFLCHHTHGNFCF